MGNNMSTPSEARSSAPRNSIRSAMGSISPRKTTKTSKDTRTTPRSVDVSDAASPATMALKPAATGHTPPKPLAKTVKSRNIDRSAFTFFSCGRNVFIHFVGMALLDRKIVKAKPGTTEFEKAAEEVWVEVAMHDPQQRALWEDAAKQAKAALTNETVAAELLLEKHGLPARQAEYQAWAASAVEELLARFAAGTWPKNGQQAAAMALDENDESEARERAVEASVERELVSAINLRDLQSQHFVGVEPSIRGFDPTPSIAPSLSSDLDTEAEIVTTERVAPVKAKLVDC